MTMMSRMKVAGVAVSLAVMISACGGGGDSSDDSAKVLKGVFTDAPVKGLGYQTVSRQGTTNAKGEFEYQAGEAVSFFLNGIRLGQAEGQASVPVTLLDNSPAVARILQTLDHDANPAVIDVSGIKLDAATKEKLGNIIANKDKADRLDSVLTDARLAEIQTNSGVTLVNQSLLSDSAVAEHLGNSLDAIPVRVSDLSGKVFLDSDGRGIGSESGCLSV